MINWFIVFAIIIIALMIFKIEHTKRRIYFFFMLGLILLIYFSFTKVLVDNNVELNSISGIGKAINLYFSWIGDIYRFVWVTGKDIFSVVGNSIKSNYTDVPRR